MSKWCQHKDSLNKCVILLLSLYCSWSTVDKTVKISDCREISTVDGHSKKKTKEGVGLWWPSCYYVLWKSTYAVLCTHFQNSAVSYPQESPVLQLTSRPDFRLTHFCSRQLFHHTICTHSLFVTQWRIDAKLRVSGKKWLQEHFYIKHPLPIRYC